MDDLEFVVRYRKTQLHFIQVDREQIPGFGLGKYKQYYRHNFLLFREVVDLVKQRTI